jgi:aconitate hydratase
VAKGLTVKPWVKTSLAPGSQVVAEYLEPIRPAEGSRQARLQSGRLRLHHLHRQFGPAAGGDFRRRSTTTIWSPPRCCPAIAISRAASIADVRANYLASPPLVVAYALAGSMQTKTSPRRRSVPTRRGKVYLRDIWPTSREINEFIRKNINKQMFKKQIRQRVQGRHQLAQDQRQGREADLQVGHELDLRAEPALFRRHAEAPPADRRRSSTRACWRCSSTRSPPTTSRRPARSRKKAPAGEYLREHQGAPKDFNQYGTRRGNHEVMMRGTFANIRIKNQMVPGVEGGYTIHYPSASA